MSPHPLISIIVPVYNGERFLTETLVSALAQTFGSFEIIIVDDGSKDASSRLIEEFVRRDSRIRGVRQTNAGVAAARNRGIAEAKGEFIAPLDADDLWRPEKLERQIQAFERGGPSVDLVYTWSERIDETGAIIEGRAMRHTEEGQVLRESILYNLVAHASGALMRRDAVLKAGGYDESLRAQRAQGCEDKKLYIGLAENGAFASVKEDLVGYRRTDGAMSRNVPEMRRSHDLVMNWARARHPELPQSLFVRAKSLLELWFCAESDRGLLDPVVRKDIRAAWQRDPKLILTRWFLGQASFAVREAWQEANRQPVATQTGARFLPQI
jgi:glycosyltransferase involved in cell wall biosynthesis